MSRGIWVTGKPTEYEITEPLVAVAEDFDGVVTPLTELTYQPSEPKPPIGGDGKPLFRTYRMGPDGQA